MGLGVLGSMLDDSMNYIIDRANDWSWSTMGQIALYGVGVLGVASAGYIYFTAGPPIPVPDALRMQ